MNVDRRFGLHVSASTKPIPVPIPFRLPDDLCVYPDEPCVQRPHTTSSPHSHTLPIPRFPLPKQQLRDFFFQTVEPELIMRRLIDFEDHDQFHEYGIDAECFKNLISDSKCMGEWHVQSLGKHFIAGTNYLYLTVYETGSRHCERTRAADLLKQVLDKSKDKGGKMDQVTLQGIVFVHYFTNHFAGIALAEDPDKDNLLIFDSLYTEFNHPLLANQETRERFVGDVMDRLMAAKRALDDHSAINFLLRTEKVAEAAKTEFEALLTSGSSILSKHIKQLYKRFDENIRPKLAVCAQQGDRDGYSCGPLALQSLILYTHGRPYGPNDVLSNDGNRVKKYFLATLAGKLKGQADLVSNKPK